MESFWLVVGCKHANEPLYSTKHEKFLNYLGNYYFSGKVVLHGASHLINTFHFKCSTFRWSTKQH